MTPEEHAASLFSVTEHLGRWYVTSPFAEEREFDTEALARRHVARVAAPIAGLVRLVTSSPDEDPRWAQIEPAAIRAYLRDNGWYGAFGGDSATTYQCLGGDHRVAVHAVRDAQYGAHQVANELREIVKCEGVGETLEDLAAILMRAAR